MAVVPRNPSYSGKAEAGGEWPREAEVAVS